jgi:hypothetical protein
MTELETKTEAEDFADELSDAATCNCRYAQQSNQDTLASGAPNVRYP